MLDPAQVPAVASEEMLARFVLFSAHFRKANATVKPDAFMPHPRVELSITRHLEATTAELWREGGRVAALRALALYGRADVLTEIFETQRLRVVPEPIPENPNHADVIDWPADKPQQKMKATVIASRAQFVPRPS